jgi:CRISPR-associated protein Csm3
MKKRKREETKKMSDYYKFLGNIIIRGNLTCVTGLHIGGVPEGYEIGGMDNPVIRDIASGYPYIPGSSLKGKKRSLLEWAEGLVSNNGEVHKCKNSSCSVCRSFGTPAETERKIGPTRLTVRDAYPSESTVKMMDRLQREKGLPKVEWKTENNLNRITSAAVPRSLERVPRGSEFCVEIVYAIYQIEGENELVDLDHLKYLFKSMCLLEDSAVGGYASRGSGRIRFGSFGYFDKDGNIIADKISRLDSDSPEKGLEIIVRPWSYYASGAEKEEEKIKRVTDKATPANLLGEFDTIKNRISQKLNQSPHSAL